MNKILLLQPPVSFEEKAFALVPNCPHLGLLYLAASLISNGFEVEYLDVSDNSLDLKNIFDYINEKNIDVICITTMTQNIKGAVQLAKFLKESDCRAKIIAGGPHVSADYGLINRFPFFDIAITGEAELTLPKVIKSLLYGKEVKGVVKGETPMDLDALPFPARQIVDHSIYKKRGVWANGIFATRGCPYKCNFCSIPAIDKKVRFRKTDFIIEEMKLCYSLTKMNHFNFSDDALTIDRKFVYELCDKISKMPFRIKWEAQSRINYVDSSLLRVMRKAGCYKLLFGIESGNERIRNQIIGKNITDEQIANATKLCWQEGIEPDHYLMIGQPTETVGEIMDTVNCPLKFNPNIIGIFITMPLPGSPLFDRAISEGVIDKDVIDKYVRGEYGQGYQGCWPYYVPKGLTKEELIQYRNLAYRKFYYRFSYVLRRIRQDCTSIIKLKRDIKEGLSLFLKNRPADDFNVINKHGIVKRERFVSRQLSKIEKVVARFPLIYRFLKKCKVFYQTVKYYFFKLTGREKELIYNRSFFDKNLEWNIPIAETLSNIIMQFFHPHSVVDVGCGNAEFLHHLQKKGLEIYGYEGSIKAIESALIDRKFIKQFDLKNLISSDKSYELALCLEVAEHIENKFSERLIENLTLLSDTVIFTAAPPGQGGHFHINEQPRTFWNKLFENRGFYHDDALTDKMQKEFRDKKVISWYADNLMIFKKK
jgi:radical SAM superfamily enzyme YgiQ (UPF0313 family)